MSLAEKKIIIEQGKNELAIGKFPENTLAEIKDSRLRADVSKQIFETSGVNYDSLSIKQKELKKLRLKAQLLFEDYLQTFLIFSNVSYLLVIIGIVSILSTMYGMNDNQFSGLITLMTGFFIYLIALKKKLVLKVSLITAIAYLSLFIIELLVLGLPEPYMKNLSNAILSDNITALLKSINIISPYMYFITRITLAGVLFMVCKRQINFIKAKSEFESLAKNNLEA